MLQFHPFAFIALSIIAHVAQGSNLTTAPTFIYSTSSGPFIFSINAIKTDDQTVDLYLYLSSPSIYSWIAVGTGTGMSSSQMFIAYASGSGDGITLSPRFSKSESEPVHNPLVSLSILPDSAITNNTYHISALCRNCTRWPTVGSHASEINLTSPSAPFIFALGPSGSIRSTLPSASLRRHTLYGCFTMDLALISLSSNTGVPSPAAMMIGAALSGHPQQDSDYVLLAHWILMLGAYVVLMALGVVWLRVLGRVRWHAWNQFLATVVTVLGVGTGGYVSLEYNDTKSFTTAHQAFGLVLFVATLAQLALGYFHHRLYNKYTKPTLLGRVHRYLGPAILMAAVINGGLGIRLVGNVTVAHVVVYSIVAVMILGAAYGVSIWKASSKDAASGLRETDEVGGEALLETGISNDHTSMLEMEPQTK